MTASEWVDYIKQSRQSSTWTFPGLNSEQCGRVADAIELALSARDAEIAELRGLLKECEWVVPVRGVGDICTICDGIEPTHKAKCRLAAALEGK